MSKTNERLTLKTILHDAGIEPAQIKKVMAALDLSTGKGTQRRIPVMIKEGNDWRLDVFIRSRLDDDSGAMFSIKNIRL